MAALEARMPMPPSGQARTEVRNQGIALRPGSLSEPELALTVTYLGSSIHNQEGS
jgi:hypothetical protein